MSDPTLPIHSLWRLLGNTYTCSSDVDNMLDILQIQISRSQVLQKKYIVCDVDFTTKVIAAEHSTVKEYLEGEIWAWMRGIGEEVFLNKKKLLTIAHLGQIVGSEGKAFDHWAPVVVDCENALLCYGDSLANGVAVIPPKLEAAYLCWKERHTFLDFSSSPLPISQQLDSHSCGLFACNALDHLVNPETVNLLIPAEAVCARMQAFKKIADTCLQYGYEASAGYESSDPDESEVEESTPFQFGSSNRVAFTFRSESLHAEQQQSNYEDEISTFASCPPTSLPEPEPESDFLQSKIDAANSSDGYEKHSLDSDWEMSDTGAESALVFDTDMNVDEVGAENRTHIEAGFESDSPRDDEASTQISLKNTDIVLFWGLKKETEMEKERTVNEKRVKQHAQGAKRQQALRDRQKEAQEKDGVLPKAFSKRKRGVESLEDDIEDGSGLADISRPHRGFKEESRESQKPQGRKCTKMDESAKNMNWFQLLIWSQIKTAAKKAGKPWWPSEIVHEARKMNPKLFAQLAEQTLGRWISKKAKSEGWSKWRADILSQVDLGN
ncbi:hypothetical protein BT96DRAFT_1008400 [Gymnopus androsaceus JB14]|uniref:Ubiquitin-like protease family profile domain-containing protein n=1 Tax=Gymnopus androsaceus JB14 TaxID=1447944 RepID=A0A6A4GEY8_9AGAR|nr:hypothetical protein BT96DRAFT_1008400 [Gymnopus androsaceus JB14]